MDSEEKNEENGDLNIRVAVRCRPFNSKEKANAEQSCAKILPNQIVLYNPNNSNEEHSFGFDLVFGEDVSQQFVWEQVGLPILNKAITGYNGTIFAYGQTGSGKTWSMQGGDGDLQGIIPRMNITLFQKIASEKTKRPTIQFLVTVSYFEIYNEIIFDLLDPSDRKKRKGGLEIKEHPALGVYVKGLQEIVIDNASKLQSIIDQGMKNRTVASTQMNADSSRSHSVFTITIHQKDEEDQSKNVFAKVNLVDLAGSERVKSTQATGATLKEGANINKSLSALGNVINALVEAGKGKSTFIPYRNSKLTRVLQESLGGNSITSMLAAMSPAFCNLEETLSTLKYANRAKAIKIKAVKNEEASQVSRLNDEIRMLREKLMAQGGQQGGNSSDLSDKNKQQLRELELAVRNTWEAKSKMSAEYETERKRLLQEQQLAAQQLQIAKQRNWELLEQKAHLELTLSHVKDLVKSNPNAMVEIENWLQAISKLSQVEKATTDQYTVVQVFRSSIEKDSKNLLKIVSTKNSVELQQIDSNQIINIMNQFKEKSKAISDELMKWINLQVNTFDILFTMNNEVVNYTKYFQISQELEKQEQEFISSITSIQLNSAILVDSDEVIRGLALINKQLKNKIKMYQQSLLETQEKINQFDFIFQEMIHLLKLYSSALNKINPNDLTSINATENLQKLLDQIKEYLDLFSSLTGNKNNSPVKPPKENKLVLQYEKAIRNVNYTIANPSIYTLKKHYLYDSVNNASVETKEFCLIHTGDQADRSALLKIDQISDILSIEIKGTNYIMNKIVGPSDIYGSNPNPSSKNGKYKSDISLIDINTFKLENGICLADCTGDPENTTKIIGSIIDWTILLKNNPPEKFLKRPPVRFLFDLIKYIAEQNPGSLPSVIETADWTQVGATKESKIEFMELIIQFVATKVKSSYLTSGSSIITGADSDLTNKLLAQLAICVEFDKQQKSIMNILNEDCPEENETPEVDEFDDKPAKMNKIERIISKSWLLKFKLSYSLDGEAWLDYLLPNGDSTLSTSVDSPEATFIIDFPKSVPMKFIKLVPIQWFNSEESVIPCFIVHLIGNNKLPHEDENILRLLDDSFAFSSISVLDSTITKTRDFLQQIIGFEQNEKNSKQEILKKQMEKLAEEKALLAQSLATEKESLLSNNQDLTAQVRLLMNQLEETKKLLEKEQSVNSQLTQTTKSLEDEKINLIDQLREQENENTNIQTSMLKLQTLLDSEKVSKQHLEEELEQKIVALENSTNELSYLNKNYEALEAEKDELLSQISILTEERDAARNQEEILFEKLTDSNAEIEALQESYVTLSDRCNDAQDEVSDLRDQIESLQNTIQALQTLNNRSLTNNLSTSAMSPLRSSINQQPQSFPIESQSKTETLSNSQSKKSSGPQKNNNPSPATSKPTSKSLPPAYQSNQTLTSKDDSKSYTRTSQYDDLDSSPQKLTARSNTGIDENYQEDFED